MRTWYARAFTFVWAAGTDMHALAQARGGEQGDLWDLLMPSHSASPRRCALQSICHRPASMRPSKECCARRAAPEHRSSRPTCMAYWTARPPCRAISCPPGEAHSSASLVRDFNADVERPDERRAKVIEKKKGDRSAVCMPAGSLENQRCVGRCGVLIVDVHFQRRA